MPSNNLYEIMKLEVLFKCLSRARTVSASYTEYSYRVNAMAKIPNTKGQLMNSLILVY